MKEKFKTIWTLFLRFGLSGILLGWLFSRIDYKHTWAAVKEADPAYLLMAFLIFFSTCAVILWRWIIFLKALNLKFDRLNAARWFFIGQFFNLFLPTSVGGDVIKAFGIASQTGNKPKVFASIVLDRLTGMVGIVLVASVSFFFSRKIVGDASLLTSIASLTGVIVVLGVILFSRRVFAFVCKLFESLPKVREALMKLHHDLILMRDRKKEFAMTLGLSMLAQVMLAYDFYLVAQGLHQDIPFVYFIIFSPLVCVVTSLPSIGGLGVREIGWVYLLAKVGVPQNVALALSLLNFTFMVLVGLLGGLWYVTTFSARRVQHHQTDVQLESRNA